MTEALVTVEVDGPIATVTLVNPHQRGAMTFEAMVGLREAFEELAPRSDVRVVVLASEGAMFSSGHNLREMAGDDAEWHRRFFEASADMMLAMRRMPQPIVAQVHASSAAAGCQLIAGCDLAVAADDARFSVAGPRIGMFPMLPAVPMVRTMGEKMLLRLYLTGDSLAADEALTHGLVSHVVPAADVVAATREVAERIASYSGQVIGDGKLAFHRLLDMADEGARYAFAVEAVCANVAKPDAQEGIAAFLEKRDPVWEHRS